MIKKKGIPNKKLKKKIKKEKEEQPCHTEDKDFVENINSYRNHLYI